MSALEEIRGKIENEKGRLLEMARAIYEKPEVGGEEYFASELISGYLRERGFKVWKGVGGLKTAFMASFGEEGFHVAFCSEYDALPDIGHGCGHNLIAIASAAAGMALAAALGKKPGRVSVVGTPNEEGEGGKVDLVKTGVFDDVDAAMMFHPGCSTCLDVESLACCDYKFIFHGRSVHASTEPWEGRNALDGVIQAFNSINAMRQHLKDDARIHGIISEGGRAPNVVPERAVADFIIRARDSSYLGEVLEKVITCARGAALSTGTVLEVFDYGYPYDAMISNRVMVDVFRESLEESGYKIESPQVQGLGSMDMGNVSWVTPSIYPVLAITDQWVPGHTREFSQLCNTEQAYTVMLDAARALAFTGVKIIDSKSLQQKIREEFKAATTKR